MHSAKMLLNPFKIIAPRIVSVLLLIAAMIGTYVMLKKSLLESDALIDWQRHRLGPRDSLRVYWVGHSLMEAQVDTSAGKLRLLEIVGLMAEAQGLAYTMGDHTLWGAPLSLQWRGRPHSHDRSVPERAIRRRLFEIQAASYDAIVLTETIPIRAAMKYEYSSYYIQQFYCALMQANPAARVYLYESWPHLQALSPQRDYPSPKRYDWRERTLQDRRLWERLADEASTATIPKPSWLARLTSVLRSSAPACKLHIPIFLVPVGTAMVELFHPDTWIHSRTTPNRLRLLRDYVSGGGGLLMFGGYYSFQGINGGARYHKTPVEDVLPVNCLSVDDRVEVPEGFSPKSHRQGRSSDPEWPWNQLADTARLQRSLGQGRCGGFGNRVDRLRFVAAAGHGDLRQGTNGGVDVGCRPALAAARFHGLGRLQAAVRTDACLGNRHRLSVQIDGLSMFV